jgi:AcrR family transcriptional regulator
MNPRTQRTIDSLVRAAEEIFSERPADDVTVEEIAERAQVAVGSIYNHFGSKAGLHAAVAQRALEADRQYMDRAYTADRTAIEQLYAASDEYLEFYLAHPEYFRMLAYPDDPGRYAAGRELSEQLAEAVDVQNRRMVEALRRGVEAGVVRALVPEDVATVLWAAWNGVISLGWRPDSLRRTEPELRELLRTATDVVANGLLVR